MPGAIGGSLLMPIAEALLELNVDDVRPIDHIGKLGCPLLILSGMDDRKTSEADTRELFEAASEPKGLWLIEGGRHDGLFELTGEEYRRRVLGFVKNSR